MQQIYNIEEKLYFSMENKIKSDKSNQWLISTARETYIHV